jgi:hypothetical protein
MVLVFLFNPEVHIVMAHQCNFLLKITDQYFVSNFFSVILYL